jgi:uncharacterized protein
MVSSTHPPVILQMQQPGFYPHPVTEPIALIQTHISYVLLTGEYAYKVKKPVNFGFLDFSTLEKRHHFCQEELRLNQRGAKDLYLDVMPIVQIGDRYQLAGSGAAVEYTLKMRQFPQEDLFLALFEAGKLTASDLDELGQVVAAFHAQAATSDYIDSFGAIAAIRQAIHDNYAQTNAYLGTLQPQAQYEATRHFTDTFLDQHQHLFAKRVRDRKIRECHGDLHLRNICRWQDQILLFDCIEFNEPFRYVDVMYDVAFTVMDLDARDRPNLANAFLNRYVEETGDWDGLLVLPLYLCRQAYVRAKVNSYLTHDPGLSSEMQQAAAQSAIAYYQQAWRYTKPQAGQLILMSGLSGSGKSTVAQQLVRQGSQLSPTIQIRSDAVRKHLGGVALHEQGPSALYTPEMTVKTYDRLLELGLLLSQQGFSVILDAKYDRQALRMAAIAAAAQHQIPIQIVYCDAPVEVLQQRVNQRKGDITDADVAVLARQTFEPFSEFEHDYVQRIDTDQWLGTVTGVSI